MRAELTEATQRLQAGKVIDRAKGLLMTQQGMTEPQALHWLKRIAMDRRTSMDAVGRDLLDTRWPAPVDHRAAARLVPCK